MDNCKDIKWSSKRNWNERVYPVKYRKDVSHTSVKMSCSAIQFLVFPFCGPHAKPHGLRGLSKHYHLQIEPKLVCGNCKIQQITCACVECTNILDKPWDTGVYHNQQLCYQHVVY